MYVELNINKKLQSKANLKLHEVYSSYFFFKNDIASGNQSLDIVNVFFDMKDVI